MGCTLGESHPRHRETRPAVLIVEDEILVRMATAEHLRGVGYEVIEAANAKEAIDILRHNAEVRLVVSDVRMPGLIDGIALARLIRADFPHLKILLASGELFAVGSVDHDGFFRKPYSVAALAERIRALID